MTYAPSQFETLLRRPNGTRIALGALVRAVLGRMVRERRLPTSQTGRKIIVAEAVEALGATTPNLRVLCECEVENALLDAEDASRKAIAGLPEAETEFHAAAAPFRNAVTFEPAVLVRYLACEERDRAGEASREAGRILPGFRFADACLTDSVRKRWPRASP